MVAALSLDRAEITMLLTLQKTSLTTVGLTSGDAETATGNKRESVEERIVRIECLLENGNCSCDCCWWTMITVVDSTQSLIPSAGGLQRSGQELHVSSTILIVSRAEAIMHVKLRCLIAVRFS